MINGVTLLGFPQYRYLSFQWGVTLRYPIWWCWLLLLLLLYHYYWYIIVVITIILITFDFHRITCLSMTWMKDCMRLHSTCEIKPCSDVQRYYNASTSCKPYDGWISIGTLEGLTCVKLSQECWIRLDRKYLYESCIKYTSVWKNCIFKIIW